MGESDFARQMREDRERWERQREEEDRRQKEAERRTDLFLRWFAWPMCALMGLMFLVLLYTVTPAIINAVIKATHQWQALLR
jgi:cell division septal protein FtsQ